VVPGEVERRLASPGRPRWRDAAGRGKRSWIRRRRGKVAPWGWPAGGGGPRAPPGAVATAEEGASTKPPKPRGAAVEAGDRDSPRSAPTTARRERVATAMAAKDGPRAQIGLGEMPAPPGPPNQDLWLTRRAPRGGGGGAHRGKPSQRRGKAKMQR
jgi:hypothetical protein